MPTLWTVVCLELFPVVRQYLTLTSPVSEFSDRVSSDPEVEVSNPQVRSAAVTMRATIGLHSVAMQPTDLFAHEWGRSCIPGGWDEPQTERVVTSR